MDTRKLGQALNKVNITAFRFFEQVGSTNDLALDWLASGAPEYALVIADAQNAGRGRQGRHWVTTPGASIALSLILYPSQAEQEKLGLFPLASGLAVARAIEEIGVDQVQVKWPNDVLIKRMKTAGVLVESVWEGDRLHGMVIGIGINVQRKSVPAAVGLLYPATCIEDHTTVNVDVITLITGTISNLVHVRTGLLNSKFHENYTSKLAFLKEKVAIRDQVSQSSIGTLEGIDPAGQLLQRLDDGRLQTFAAGDVSLRPI